MAEYNAELVELCTDLKESCCPVGVQVAVKKGPKLDPNRERVALKGPELLKVLNIQLGDAPSEERMLQLKEEADARRVVREEAARQAAAQGATDGA